MYNFKIGDTVKFSEFYFSILAEYGCPKKSMVSEKEKTFTVAEIPAKHGSKNSVGIISEDEPNTITACTRKDIVLM
jgi:hypothetical protein